MLSITKKLIIEKTTQQIISDNIIEIVGDKNLIKIKSNNTIEIT